MPLHFSEDERRALSTRLIVQPPGSARAVERHVREQRRRIEGIPIDVLETLDAIRILAEAGNKVAQALYMDERRKLGIDLPRTFG